MPSGLQGFRFAAPWEPFAFPVYPENHKSVRGCGQLPKAAPAARFFRRLTMRQLSTNPHHHIAGGPNIGYLILRQMRRHPGGIWPKTPANATKPIILLRSSGLFIRQGFGCPAQRNKITVVVAFAFRDPAFLLSVVLIVGYHKPPSMSTRFSPG